MMAYCNRCGHERDAHSREDGQCLFTDCPTCTGWEEPQRAWPVVSELDGDGGGYICLDCNVDLPINAPYAEVVTGVNDDESVYVEIICVYCELNRTAA